MTDEQSDLGALKREWLLARIVVIGGFALAIAAGAYVGIRWRNAVLEARQQAAATVSQDEAEQASQEANSKERAALCQMMLANAQHDGIVPNYTQLTSADPSETKQTGRYSCSAATTSSAFTLSADLVCRDLKNPKCVSLYSVTQNGGAILYQRRD